MELVSNRHLSSISCMKYRYVGGKHMHFITSNTVPSRATLRVVLRPFEENDV
jgi:hypothetical protein